MANSNWKSKKASGANRKRSSANSIWKSKKAAVAISYASIFLSAITTMLLTAAYVNKLGRDVYGLYQMIYSVAHYILILDLGICTTMMRFISEFDARGDTVKKENFAFHMLVIAGFLAMLIGTAGYILDQNLENIYPKLQGADLELSHRIFRIMVRQLMLAVLSMYLEGILLAHDMFTFVRSFALINIFLSYFVITTVLNMGYGLVGIVYARTALVSWVIVVRAIVAFFGLKFKIKFHYLDMPMLKPVCLLMFAMLLQSIVGHVNSTVDKTILGIMMERSDVAVYSIASTFVVMFNGLPTQISTVFQTKVVRAVVGGATPDDLGKLVSRTGRYQFVVAAGFTGGFLLFGQDFIRCWVGRGFEDAWIYALVIMPPNMIPLIQNTMLAVLNALDKRIFRSLVLAGMTVVNIGLTVLLIKLIGPLGAPLATGISYLIGHVVLMNVYYHRRLHINVFKVFGDIFSKIWLAAVVTTLINTPLLFWQGDRNWTVFAVKAACFCITYALALWYYGLNQEERGIFAGIANKVRIPLKA